jgi:PAS domain S-box-containing protein
MTRLTRTLLIVEDFPADRELYRRYLLNDVSCIYLLLEAESAAAGLALCQTQSIDAILLDYLLPDANGLDFLESLSAQSQGHSPPVVMMTGQGSESIAVRAMKLGAQDYLVKRDLTPELLQLTIRRAIAASTHRQNLPPSDATVRTSGANLFDYSDIDPAIGDRSEEIIDSGIVRLSSVALERDLTTDRDISGKLSHLLPEESISIAQSAAERDRDRFFDLSIDLLSVGNFDGYFTRLNPAWEEVFGYTRAELMAQPYLDFVHPDDRASTLGVALNIGTDKSLLSFENRYRCRDGSYRWLLWNAMPCIEQGLFYAIGRDITERKQAETIVLESQQKFSAIFNRSFGPIVLLNVRGVVLEINQAALNSIGAVAAEIVGKALWDTPWWNHSPQLQRQLQESIERAATGEFIRYELAFPHLSGIWVTVDFSLKPVFDEFGQVKMTIAQAWDITDRQLAQADLEQRNQELDSFAHIVSHDLKAPLRAIANLSEWIEDDLAGLLNEGTQQQMTLLRSRVRRMEATIAGLLDYARVGRTDVEISQVVVAELLAETIDSLAPPPKFKIAIDPMPTLDTKRLLLSQVFANLIGNAIKHHDSPGEPLDNRANGSVQITCQDRGDFYEFAVSDDGPGIALPDRDKIFTIFQARNPQHRPDSSGIGLSIVKKIVEAESGKVWLESELNVGTTFYFTWPKFRE